MALIPIDERLRYLIPFRPTAETASYLRDLAARGHPLAVLADDGVKFGGWPGTRKWVYEDGWLDQLSTMAALVDGGEVLLTTCAEALTAVPTAGLAYLPTASYREMESWSLPAAAARRLHALERELGDGRLVGPEGALAKEEDFSKLQEHLVFALEKIKRNVNIADIKMIDRTYDI